MLSSGDVTENWWLKNESTSNCNHLLPCCMSMDFKHPNFTPMELQQMALKLTVELNPLNYDTVSRILRVGYRGRALQFATLLLGARLRHFRQSRKLLKQVEQIMGADSRAHSQKPSVRLDLIPEKSSVN